MTNTNNSTAFYLGATLRQIAKLLRKQFNEQGILVTPEQFGLLDLISKKDEFIQSDLATLMDKDKSAILRQLDILEEYSYIRRINDPADRRKKFLEVTETGIQVLEKCKNILSEIMEGIEKGIDSKDMEVFKSVLTQLKANGEKL